MLQTMQYLANLVKQDTSLHLFLNPGTKTELKIRPQIILVYNIA